MDKVQPPKDSAASPSIVIDAQAISLIKNEMRKEFVDRPFMDVTILAINHLYYFVLNRGGTPGFTIKEEKKK